MQCMAESTDVKRHLDQGKKLLAAGQLADALSHYHMAIEGDPNNYMTYFHRATVYLALGKSKSAMPDLDKVLELKPDFNAARMQRANVKLKQGKLDEADEDYSAVISQDPANSEAIQQLGSIPSIREMIKGAKEAMSQNDYNVAIQYLSGAIEVCPWHADLHEMRATCYEQIGDYQKAIQDMKPVVKLISDNTVGYLRLSTLLYRQGEIEESLKEIRECLKLDPDQKGCHDHYKKVKKLAKQFQDANKAVESKDWPECLKKAEQALKTESRVPAVSHMIDSLNCQCNSEAKNVDDALKHCTKVLEERPDDVDALCNRAEAYVTNQQYEEAVSDYKHAQSVAGDSRRVQEGLQKAEKLLKQSQKRDYYKILGVSKVATKAEIMKKYRKLAAMWHPDQYRGDDKKMAEKKFIDLADAKEVLTDPDKRAKFDQGEDPLDPEQQAGGGPQWHQGFNPFGHGGFQFKFHFN